jgi:uncharacterized membrane protein
MSRGKTFNVQKLVLLALLTSVVVVLQLLASLIPVYPFRLTLVLMPIVIGSALIGKAAGAWLGFAFGFIVLVSSPDVPVFLQFNAPATVFLILLRGTLAGFSAGLIYELLERKSKTVAVVSAAIICPIVNTGLFVVGLYVFFLPLISEWYVGFANVTAFIFLGMIGINFIIEFAVNLVLSPTIVRLVQYRRESRGKVQHIPNNG